MLSLDEKFARRAASSTISEENESEDVVAASPEMPEPVELLVEENLDEGKEENSNLRLRISKNDESSVNLDESDNNNNNKTNEKPPVEQTNESNSNEDEQTIDKIEAVKNDQDGISFRIRFPGEKDAKWIPAKVANKKYPQSVIAFWESHVEFT